MTEELPKEEEEVEEEETELKKETRTIRQTHDSREDPVSLTRERKLWGCAGTVWTISFLAGPVYRRTAL